MRRRLFHFCAAVSLILLLLAPVMWLRSLRNVEYIQWTDARHFPGIASSGGRVIWSYQFFPNGVGGNTLGWTIGSWEGAYWKAPDRNDLNTWADSRNYLLGFEWSPNAGRPPRNSKFPLLLSHPTTFVIGVPYWFVCLALSLILFQWFRVQSRRKRLAKNRCLNCGYDLRASPERCPECGNAIAPPAIAPAGRRLSR
jgi:hypothetical protein